MLLTKDDIMNFQALCRKHSGIELNEQESFNQALQLITLLDAISNPSNIDN